MKEMCKKISAKLRIVFGWGILLCLFAGGLTFFGYLTALCIGGETAAAICFVLYKKILPVIIYATSCLVLFGLVSMYLAGEKSLTSSSGNKYKKHLKK